MNKLYPILILLILGLLGVLRKMKRLTIILKNFRVGGLMSEFDLQFKFPKTFISVRDIDVEKLNDTTNITTKWQSVLIIVNSLNDKAIDKYLLEY